MAPLQYQSHTKVLLFLVFFLFTSFHVCANTLNNDSFLGTRKNLEVQNENQPIKKKTTPPLSTKLIKPTTSPKNQTKLIKTTTISTTKNQTKPTTSVSPKNKTKLIEPITDLPATLKTQIKKLNSTSKTSNSTKPTSLLTKKSSDLTKKSTTPKNKTTNPITQKQSKTQLDKKLLNDAQPKNPDKTQIKDPKKTAQKKPTQPTWIDEQYEDDLVSEIRDLPSKFQESFIPDLDRIQATSKVYLNRANKEITNGFKPIVGKKYAPIIASIVSFAFILIPLLLVSLLFNRIKAYFSIQKLLIFIQVYLSIYFSILCLSSLVTGLEPLRFFYATSQSTYVCVQVLQTLAYVLYLLLLLMYLVLVFSTDSGLGSKLLGLAQTFVGFAVGLHYYMTVFHRVVLHQPPKSSWRVHGIYATCFLVICLLAKADRRKKAYLEEGGEEGKKN